MFVRGRNMMWMKMMDMCLTSSMPAEDIGKEASDAIPEKGTVNFERLQMWVN
jgi:hypothetical protein